MGTLNSLYIHFPFCRHLCNYCDFYKTVPKGTMEVPSFHQLLQESFLRHQNLMDEYSLKWGPLRTLYIGGGTPSLWGEEGALLLQELFKLHKIEFSRDIEFTLEINPGSWEESSLVGWKKVGVNRFSIGLQTMNSQLLEMLDRVHSVEDSFHTLNRFKGENFSVDFMLGLPFSQERKVLEEFDTVMAFKPKHISVYILTAKENYIHKNFLPTDYQIEREYLGVSEYLTSRGFQHYEVSNYSLPGMESRHNLKYWQGDSVGAVGPSATGFFALGKEGVRYKWETKKPSFTQEIVDEGAYQLERLYTLLRTNQGLSGKNFFKDLALWQVLVDKWETRGYVVSTDPLVLNPRGFLMLDSLMDEIFQTGII